VAVKAAAARETKGQETTREAEKDTAASIRVEKATSTSLRIRRGREADKGKAAGTKEEVKAPPQDLLRLVKEKANVGRAVERAIERPSARAAQ
jgi:hypothetical protein